MGRKSFRNQAPTGAALRRRGGGHGLRRGGSGGHRGAPGGHLQAGLQDPRRGGRLPPRGHHLRPQRLRRRHGHRGARQVRHLVHRGGTQDQGGVSPRPDQRWREQRVLLLPGQPGGPGGHAHGLPVPRHQGGAGPGHRQRRGPAGLRRDPGGSPRAHRGRALRPGSRGYGDAHQDRRGAERDRGAPHRGGPRVARRARGGPAFPCSGEGHRPVRGGRR